MLTQREYEVLELAARGLSNQAISEKLCVDYRTVRQHLVNIYGKLNIDKSHHKRVSAVLYFLKNLHQTE